jgi:hypothetical protein
MHMHQPIQPAITVNIQVNRNLNYPFLLIKPFHSSYPTAVLSPTVVIPLAIKILSNMKTEPATYK